MKRALPTVLVSLQFLLLAALVVLAFVPHDRLWPGGPIPLIAGAVLVAAGLAVAVLGVRGLGSALTASPVPLEGATLVTSGVYSRVRHPIYTGLLAGGAGVVVMGASLGQVVVWAALLVLLMVKARWEERMLLAAHPDYRAYAARSGRFLPGLGRLR